ncbi:hypothetical protein [Streptomyces sp. H39-S7]|uniref:hypothetical protein n=1 Tax=Streptomyces sp. H39-S7 TaxID=3004357 RepID=UPI0022B00D5F|nr:hypothetical protein [Streptomyces sp. H39-S7]MCZ4124967.1 hypothetical protein [Streptomyces sp. H39-S7]
MPKDHARKTQLASLKTTYGVKHVDAIALLDHPDAQERTLLCQLIASHRDVTTYRDALARHEQYRAAAAVFYEDWDDLDGCDCGYATEEGRFHCCDCGAGHEYACVC